MKNTNTERKLFRENVQKKTINFNFTAVTLRLKFVVMSEIRKGNLLSFDTLYDIVKFRFLPHSK